MELGEWAAFRTCEHCRVLARLESVNDPIVVDGIGEVTGRSIRSVEIVALDPGR